jgi:1,4-alpha-glucan branching enzyme
MIGKRPSANDNRVIVSFEIPGSIWAERINLVGDFNGWDRHSLPFHRNREDNWHLELELERGREYRFRYLIDGDYWGHDWHADRHAPSSDGGYDSVILTDLSPAA